MSNKQPPSKFLTTTVECVTKTHLIPLVTMRVSDIVTKIWRLKDNGVTSLTFWGHVTSSVTKKDGRKERGRKREGEGKGK